MPDLSASWDVPNPFGLLSVDFQYDLDSYRGALGFLSDLAGGSDHNEALTTNGGNGMMLTAWKRNEKFRRVYAKAVKAGEDEQAYLEAQEKAQEATEDEGKDNPLGQVFIPLEDLPAASSVFSQAVGPDFGA